MADARERRLGIAYGEWEDLNISRHWRRLESTTLTAGAATGNLPRADLQKVGVQARRRNGGSQDRSGLLALSIGDPLLHGLTVPASVVGRSGNRSRVLPLIRKRIGRY